MSADEQVRQYAKMLLAILDGAEWEGRNHENDPNWITCSCATHDPLMFSRWNIRLKPWELTDTVNGHTLPDGRKWMRPETWTKDRLPHPFRPLMVGEYQVPEDDELTSQGDVCHCPCESILMTENHRPVRTTRPIPGPQWLPLCDDDIPPGSVIRLTEPQSRTPWLPVYPMSSGVDIPNNGKWQFLSFEGMLDAWQINRSLAAGKWDATAWEPCRKQAP